MIRPIVLAAVVAVASAAGAWAQDTGPSGTSSPPVPPSGQTPLVPPDENVSTDQTAGTEPVDPASVDLVPPEDVVAALKIEEELPPPIEGCEGYEKFCSEGSSRAGSASGSGAFISQIGDGNRAEITQRRGSTTSAARIIQRGNDNSASITQDGASSFAHIAQDGIANGASISQGGQAHSTASASQNGVGNQVSISQSAAFIEHAAVTRQNGNRNAINLTQSGDGNSADLTQEGDDNRMSVSQSGLNNALTWVQRGSGLGGPSVSMDGNDRALTIMQYNIYAPK